MILWSNAFFGLPSTGPKYYIFPAYSQNCFVPCCIHTHQEKLPNRPQSAQYIRSPCKVARPKQSPTLTGICFSVPLKNQEVASLLCISPSLVFYSPKWSTTFFQLNFDLPSPHLFKDWNWKYNFQVYLCICFNLSYIWPVSPSFKTSNIQNSQWIYCLHPIPLFLKNIVKSVDTKIKLMKMKEYRGQNFP